MKVGRDRWPESLLLVRHGESAGNVARDDAEARGLATIDIAERDMDVPLSATGCEQAAAAGTWLASAASHQPTVVVSSPYARTRETARVSLDESGLTDVELVVDERLREREFGVLDRLTKRGIVERFPEEAERRKRLGKFYYRPPGGESWCDVALRVRSTIDSLSREHVGERVLIVSHQVVILMFRYVLEHLDESEILAIDKAVQLANGSITSYVHDRSIGATGGMRLVGFNDTGHLAAAGAAVTAEADVPLAPR